MTTIKATCGNCNSELSMGPEKFLLLEGSHTEPDSYVFKCTESECGERNIRLASERVFSVLSASGVSVIPSLSEEEISKFSKNLENIKDSDIVNKMLSEEL